MAEMTATLGSSVFVGTPTSSFHWMESGASPSGPISSSNTVSTVSSLGDTPPRASPFHPVYSISYELSPNVAGDNNDPSKPSAIDTPLTSSAMYISAPLRGPSGMAVKIQSALLEETAPYFTGNESLISAAVDGLRVRYIATAGLVLTILTILEFVCRLMTRLSARKRPRTVRNDMQKDSGPADREAHASFVPAFESASERLSVEDIDIENGIPERDEAVPDDRESIEQRFDSDSPSNRTTLASDTAALGSPNSDGPRPVSLTHSIPIPPTPQSPPVRSPPPSYRIRRRQSTDGGVRLAGGGLSLHRVSSIATVSDSNATRPNSLALPIPLPPMPMSSPPPSYRTRRGRSNDSGGRSASRGPSLRRVDTSSSYSIGVASVDSLTTLPPAYQTRY